MDEKPFVCPVCGQGFDTQEEHDMHHQIEHPGGSTPQDEGEVTQGEEPGNEPQGGQTGGQV